MTHDERRLKTRSSRFNPLGNHGGRYVALAIIAVHSVLIARSAWIHSPVNSEIAHLPAGIAHWRSGRFDLLRVNPPLVRMVAALPVLWCDPATSWKRLDLDPLVRSEYPVGLEFVAANGPRVFPLYTLARLACLPFVWIGAWLCYKWGLSLSGEVGGLISLTSWCCSPEILGHGALMMPDVPAASLGLASAYSFRHWLRNPTWGTASIAGVTLGLAELTKSSLLILIPLWPVLWVSTRCLARADSGRRDWTRQGSQLGLQLVLALYVMNLGYGFEGTGRRLGDYQFLSHALSGSTDEHFPRGNRFEGTVLSRLPVPLPSNYIQGIDAQKFDFERGITSYLNGKWSKRGWWFFYLEGLAIKIPLGTWCLASIGIWSVARHGGCSIEDWLLLTIPPMALLALLTSQDGFSIHFRYLLPALPYLFIWSAWSAMAFTRGSGASKICISLFLGWMMWAGFGGYPHNLSYFNEIAGGPEHGDSYMLESNISWGQDLLFLREWYDTHPQSRPLHVASYGGIDPHYAGIDCVNLVSHGSLYDKSILARGWYAIDVNYLHSPSIGVANAGMTATQRDPVASVTGRLSGLRPEGRVGYSYIIFNVK